MCLSPVTIVNPTKYISLSHKDQFLLQVPCGHCAECAASLSSQWFYRAWYEFNDCLDYQGNSFVYFDTLTYRPADLPRVSDYFDNLPYHFPCFNHRHLRLFNMDLQQTIRRRYKGVSVRMFCSSEYGEKKHRPHYHYLFYVTGNIEPLEFSRLVAKKWKYGRTDGLPYQPRNYVISKNVIQSANTETRLRVCNYVTKYVQKSCKFDKYINSRVDKVMQYLESRLPAEFKDSRHSRRVRQRVMSLCGQFHRQSQEFGASALRDIDLNQLFKDGVLYMPHFKGVKVPVNLPTYYKRKLFQELVLVDGVRCWQDTALGKEYKRVRRHQNIKRMQSVFDCAKVQFNIPMSRHLSDYVFNRRGRIIAPFEESTISERLQHLDLFSYNHRSDIERFGFGAMYEKYHGNSTKGYTNIRGSELPLQDFIDKYVYLDEQMEQLLDGYYKAIASRNHHKQKAFALKQHLQQVFKEE